MGSFNNVIAMNWFLAIWSNKCAWIPCLIAYFERRSELNVERWTFSVRMLLLSDSLHQIILKLLDTKIILAGHQVMREVWIFYFKPRKGQVFYIRNPIMESSLISDRVSVWIPGPCLYGRDLLLTNVRLDVSFSPL